MFVIEENGGIVIVTFISFSYLVENFERRKGRELNSLSGDIESIKNGGEMVHNFGILVTKLS